MRVVATLALADTYTKGTSSGIIVSRNMHTRNPSFIFEVIPTAKVSRRSIATVKMAPVITRPKVSTRHAF